MDWMIRGWATGTDEYQTCLAKLDLPVNSLLGSARFKKLKSRSSCSTIYIALFHDDASVSPVPGEHSNLLSITGLLGPELITGEYQYLKVIRS